MIAEIHNKISSTGSNLSDRLEDQLTGDFFGTMKYIPYNCGLQKILGYNVGGDNEEPKYHFWKRLKDANNSTVEPDLILEFKNAVIGIEVKYNSGLSSNDSEEGAEQSLKDDSKEIKESNNQLVREARAIIKEYNNKSKHLIFIAQDNYCSQVFEEANTKIKQECREEVSFEVISWSDIYDRISELLNAAKGYEFIILNDILALLEKKGFDRFKSFVLKDNISIIENLKGFNFECGVSPFGFKSAIKIEKELFYEFR